MPTNLVLAQLAQFVYGRPVVVANCDVLEHSENTFVRDEASHKVRMNSGSEVLLASKGVSHYKKVINEHELRDSLLWAISLHGPPRPLLRWATKSRCFPIISNVSLCPKYRPGRHIAEHDVSTAAFGGTHEARSTSNS